MFGNWNNNLLRLRRMKCNQLLCLYENSFIEEVVLLVNEYNWKNYKTIRIFPEKKFNYVYNHCQTQC